MRLSECGNLVRLNLQALSLVLRNRWLDRKVFSLSYDRLSAEYDSEWRIHIEGMTLEMLERIPERSYRSIIDLGCGTGFSTGYLDERFHASSIVGIDISEGMLLRARTRYGSPDVYFILSDMLDYLCRSDKGSADLLFSAWAIGYSNPSKIIEEAARILESGGAFSFIVNYSDTLPEIFVPYRKVMLSHPHEMSVAMRPRFPSDRKFIEKNLNRQGFRIIDFIEGNIPVKVKRDPDGKALPWLLKTGILAGFDRAMSLDVKSDASAEFEKLLSGVEVIHHHYAGVIAIKS